MSQNGANFMSAGLFNLRKAFHVYGRTPEELETLGVKRASLPEFPRSQRDNRQLKSWTLEEMPLVGEKIGFLKKPRAPLAVSIFVTKGGVLKSSLTLNLARLAALHNIRTVVVGLDMQGDITTALSAAESFEGESESGTSLSDALERMAAPRGLADVYSGRTGLNDVIQTTDIPTLFYVPETPELVALDQSLVNRNRREYWLKENVVDVLKSDFDLILLDCSPNWNRLITNALIASDALLSPVECKINNFRNLEMFRALIREFQNDMRADFMQLYVPTRLAPSRKLSREIYDWYSENLPECVSTAIRESIQGEEAMAVRQSVPEYAPTSAAADEMRELVREVWRTLLAASKKTRPTIKHARRKTALQGTRAPLV